MFELDVFHKAFHDPAGQVALAGKPDAELFMALARMAERRVGEFKSQELANTAWA